MNYIFGATILVSISLVYGSGPAWDGLRVTWSLNPFNGWGFDPMPRDLAEKGGLQLRDNQCNTSNAKFVGQRYWFKKDAALDPAITLIYDTKGIIAGIQTSIPKSSNYTLPTGISSRQYADDGDYWTLTAYFVDPSTICTSGRSKEQLKQEGTGNGLWLQSGPDPIKDSVRIPINESEVKQTNWKLGKCFWTMGNHYWYNVTKDMSCGNFVPNCLMYNKGKLTAFCFSVNADLPGPRYEHPTAELANKFIDPVPDCFFSDPTFKKLSTIHVYLIDSPRTSSWC
jgi:charged multivesicular body protein 7